MNADGFWNWSFKLCRLVGTDVRIHWSLLALMLFQTGSAVAGGIPWWWLPVLLLVPFLSILLHEFGHIAAARLVGGDAPVIIMWLFGGLAMCQAPMLPGRQFFVAAAGPAVTFMIMAPCLLVVQQGFLPEVGRVYHINGLLMATLAYTGTLNLTLLLFNLLPCYPLDGGRMARAALWPLIGLRRAGTVTIYLAYLCIAGLFVWAALVGNVMMLVLCFLLLFNALREHAAHRSGFDPYLGEPVEEPGVGTAWFERWRRQRRERARERREREESAEQELLDQLLAKVSEHGLPSLTDQERATLHRISRKQRERQESEIR